MTRLRRARLLFALASGIFLAFGFEPYNAPFVPWISLAALILATFGARWWVAILGGLLHGLGFYFLSVRWVYAVMRQHGGLEPAAAGGVLTLMVFVLALFPAAFAWAIHSIHQRSTALRACLAAPFLWVALEYARAHLPELGFPWNLLGYSVSGHLVLLQLSTLGGIYLLSFVVAAYNALFAALLFLRTRRAWITWLAVTGVLMPLLVVGHRYVPTEIPKSTAHLVQTNLPEATEYGPDWMGRHAADLGELEALSIAAGQTNPGLVVWPEVPAPFYLRDPDFAARVERIARDSGSYFLLGVVEWRPAAEGKWDGPYNSAALLDPSGRIVFTYDKIHLVPFGEYVPLRRLLSFARQLTAEIGGFKPGHEYAVGRLPGGTFSTLICFEAVFPGQTRRFVANGAELLINLSNDGWYGRTEAPEQHLAMARVRAVENRRWLLRATNNGHTVAVDPYGRIVTQLEVDRRGVLAAPFDFRSDRTLYSWWGNWFAWLCVLAALVLVGAGWSMSRAKPRDARLGAASSAPTG